MKLNADHRETIVTEAIRHGFASRWRAFNEEALPIFLAVADIHLGLLEKRFLKIVADSGVDFSGSDPKVVMHSMLALAKASGSVPIGSGSHSANGESMNGLLTRTIRVDAPTNHPLIRQARTGHGEGEGICLIHVADALSSLSVGPRRSETVDLAIHDAKVADDVCALARKHAALHELINKKKGQIEALLVRANTFKRLKDQAPEIWSVVPTDLKDQFYGGKTELTLNVSDVVEGMDLPAVPGTPEDGSTA